MRRWKLSEVEPSIEELLSDEIMALVMRSSGVNAEDLRALLRNAARRRAPQARCGCVEAICSAPA